MFSAKVTLKSQDSMTGVTGGLLINKEAALLGQPLCFGGWCIRDLVLCDSVAGADSLGDGLALTSL